MSQEFPKPHVEKVSVDAGLGSDLSTRAATAETQLPTRDAAPSIEIPATVPTANDASSGSDDHGEDEKEGGLQAWLSITGSFLVYFASFGVANSFGYFQTFYQLDYLSDYSPSVVSFIGTLQIALMYLTAPIAGSLFDLYGVKFLYPLAALGGAGSLLFTSFTQRNAIWQQFLAQGILFGLTTSYGVQPALAVAGHYFKKRRALAMGIVAAGSSAGGVTLPIMFSRLVPRIGFPWAMRVGALILLVCYVVAMALSRARKPSRKLKSFSQLLDFTGFRDRRYATMAAASFITNLGIYVPYYYIEPYCKVLDPKTGVTSYLLPLINATSLFGRIAGGQAADRYGRLNLLYPMLLLSGLFCLAMWLPATSVDTIIAFACLYGFTSGIFISVMPAATGQIIPVEKLGAQLGAYGTVSAIPILIGTPIAGALITSETREGYFPLVIFAGACICTGGIILLAARLLHDRKLTSKW